MAGAGMGLALPALAGELLPERTPEQAARLLATRHIGITVALVLLAPVAATRIDDAVSAGREQGTALVLDARLPPLEKLTLAGSLVGDLDPVDPRGELQASLEKARGEIDPEDRAAYDALAERADDALVTGVQEAFAPAFVICGALALLAALAVLPRDRRGRRPSRPPARRRWCWPAARGSPSPAWRPSRCGSPTRACSATSRTPAGSTARCRTLR